MNSNIRYFKAAKVAALVMTALCLGSINMSAQDLGVSSRSSAEVDWKIRKGLHLNAGYELRTKTSLAGIERHQVSVGIDYKVCDYSKSEVNTSSSGISTQWIHSSHATVSRSISQDNTASETGNFLFARNFSSPTTHTP